MKETVDHSAEVIKKPTFSDHDNKQLYSAPNLDLSKLSLSSRPAFGEKKTEDVLYALPDHPLYVRDQKTGKARY